MEKTYPICPDCGEEMMGWCFVPVEPYQWDERGNMVYTTQAQCDDCLDEEFGHDEE